MSYYYDDYYVSPYVEGYECGYDGCYPECLFISGTWDAVDWWDGYYDGENDYYWQRWIGLV